MLKANDLRGESREELTLKLEELKKEIFEHRSTRQDGKADKTHIIGRNRKNIARILTVLREKELEKKDA